MLSKWIGLTGMALIVAALLLGALGPRFLPNAYWGGDRSQMMNGMMNGGMMNGMMGSPSTNADQPFDRRFLDQMIVHHQHGVMMTQHMIANTERAELRDLSQRIISAQQREIEQMQQWRRDWYGGDSTSQEAMMQQMMGGGMMGQGQMQQMMGGGIDRDRMFLQMMIPHHEDAITMAQQALEKAEYPELKRLAQNIITTQSAEIDEMQRYLKDWYGITVE
ncbi:MAG TPA: DUF305 domain-containing protein [Herpetosiphonaceae bacterium]